MPEFIDPVFTKTSPKRWFSIIKRAFWAFFAKTGSIISGTGNAPPYCMYIFVTPVIIFAVLDHVQLICRYVNRVCTGTSQTHTGIHIKAFLRAEQMFSKIYRKFRYSRHLLNVPDP